MLFFWAIILIYCGWVALSALHIPRSFSKQAVSASENNRTYTVVIAARDEAPRLQNLLHSLVRWKGCAEIIVVDDHSVDATKKVVKEINRKFSKVCYQVNSGTGKKEALKTGIQQAKTDWVVTVDADLQVDEFTGRSLLKTIWESANSRMIVFPIGMERTQSAVSILDLMEWTALQGITISSQEMGLPLLANGALLAMKRDCWLKAYSEAFKRNLASGDDIFMLHTLIAQYGKTCISQAEDVLAKVQPNDSLKGLFKQRLRWARKNVYVPSTPYKLVALSYVLANITLLLTLLFGLSGFVSWMPVIIVWSLKLIADGVLISKTSRFFHDQFNLLTYLLTALIYPFYFAAIFILLPLINPVWKGKTQHEQQRFAHS